MFRNARIFPSSSSFSTKKIIFIMLVHITLSNAFLSLSHGTRDIIFNVYALDLVRAADAISHTFFLLLEKFEMSSKFTFFLHLLFLQSLGVFFSSGWFCMCVLRVYFSLLLILSAWSVFHEKESERIKAAQDKLYAKYDWVHLDWIVCLNVRIKCKN